MALPGEEEMEEGIWTEGEEAPRPMQDIPEDRESREVRWHFSTMLEPMPRNSKGCAASPWLTQWLHLRGPQGLGIFVAEPH
ncbi:putative golgin subfamily A member 8D [Macaca nemestrina]|uniref:putative golgin subfamily A member 8D n=1 Tax=Macaca nemestrina TaxID=9545 RepID=UPI0039B924DF